MIKHLVPIALFALSTLTALSGNSGPRSHSGSAGDLRQPSDSCRLDDALMYVRLADEYYDDYERCLDYAGRALPVLERFDAHTAVIDLRIGLNYVYRSAGDTAAWVDNAQRCYDDALRHLPAADELRITATNNYATVLLHARNDPAAARSVREIAYRSLPPTASPQLRGGLLYNIGNDYFRIGDFRSAERYYVVARSALLEDEHRLAVLLLRVATERCRIMTAAGDYQRAIATANEALDRLPTADRLSNTDALRCRLHLSDSYRRAGRFPRALTLLRQLSATGRLSARQRALLDYQRAGLYFDRGNYAACRNVIEATDFRNLHPVQGARAYGLLARAYERSGRPREAGRSLNEAFKRLCPDGTHPQGAAACFGHSASLTELSRLLRTQARWAANDASARSRREALSRYRHLTRLIDHARERYQSKDAQLLLLEQSASLYEEALAVIWTGYQTAPDERDSLLEAAHYFLEKSKANLLRDERNERAAFRQSRRRNALIDRQYALRSRLAVLRRREAENAAGTLNCERALERLTNSIRTDAAAHLPPRRVHDLEHVRTHLVGNNGVLINYLVGDRWIYRLRTGPGLNDLYRFPAAALSPARRDTFSAALHWQTTKETDNFNRLGLAWQRLLIGVESLPAGTERLLLVPDGPLTGLPFAALLTEEPGAGPTPYLVRRFAVNLLHSATVRPAEDNDRASGLLGVYPLFRGEGRHQRHVEDRLPRFTAYAGTHLSGRAANRAGFRAAAADRAVLLLATHARPSDSLYGEPSLSFYDGDLLLSDLAGDRLDARLAILTACASGRGRRVRGEGTMSLARGFGYAGVRSVVMSLWPVVEDVAVDQTISLLTELERGVPTDEALRRAQLAYLDGPVPEQAKAPVYWAGFTLIGDAGTIELERKPPVLSWLLWAAVAGLVFFVLPRFFIRILAPAAPPP